MLLLERTVNVFLNQVLPIRATQTMFAFTVATEFAAKAKTNATAPQIANNFIFINKKSCLKD